MAGECELQSPKCWEVGLARGEVGDRAVGALILAGPGLGADQGEGRGAQGVSRVWFFPYTCRFLILYCW